MIVTKASLVISSSVQDTGYAYGVIFIASGYITNMNLIFFLLLLLPYNLC